MLYKRLCMATKRNELAILALLERQSNKLKELKIKGIQR